MQESTLNDRPEGSFKFVSFLLNGEWYGEDIRYIQEVNRLQEITEIPGLPDYILGVINLRGKIIPIMDMRRRLGMPPVAPSEKSRILVASYGGSVLGLLVDSVHQVMEMPLSMISPPPSSVSRNRYIYGIGRFEDKLIFLLDIERIFEDSQVQMNEGEMEKMAQTP